MALTRIQPARQEEYTLYGVCHYNRVLTNQPRRCVLGRGRRGCVFLQPGHCVDSKSQWRWWWWWWWFTGLIQRLFTHKWKPCGGGWKKTEKSELPLGRNVWLFSPAAEVLSALYESPISENFMMLLEKKPKTKESTADLQSRWTAQVSPKMRGWW